MSDGTEPHASNAPPAARRSPEIDGLRGLAISLVVFWHYIVCCIPTKGPSPLIALRGEHSPLTLTWSGVDLFFVLSGYLIGGILIDARESPRYFRTFYLRRAARILPLYFFVLAFAAICFWIRPERLTWLTIGPSPPLWMYAVFAQTFWTAETSRFGPMVLGVTWSLAVEEHFYLFVPMAVRVTARRALPWLFGALVLVALAFRAWLSSSLGHRGDFIAHIAMPARLDALGLGLLSAWAMRVPAIVAWIGRRRSLLLAVTASLGLGVLAMGVGGVRMYSPAMTGYGLTLLALFYTGLLWSVMTRPSGRLASVFRLSGLRAMGTLCFGVYLWHEVVLGACHGIVFGRLPLLIDLEDFWISLLALLLTLALARASYRWLEAPFITRSHRLRY